MAKLRRPGRRSPAQPAHRFTPRLEGEHEDVAEDLSDALHEARCEDCLVGVSEGVLRITLTREAPTFQIALVSR